MQGVAPFASMQQISSELNRSTARDRIVGALDELEHLFEVIPPEMHNSAERPIHLLRQKLEQHT